jgi:hypothetical protein
MELRSDYEMLDFEVPLVDPYMVIKLALSIFLLGFFLLITVVVFLKGYQIGPKHLRPNLSFTTFAITLFGVSLGIFMLGLLLTPGYSLLDIGSERWELAITFGSIAFVSALIAVTFVTYTKRGGY